MNLRDWIREIIYSMLHAWAGQGKGVRAILLYHSVGNEAPHSVPLVTFEQQMEWLKELFKVVRLCDLPQALKNEPVEANLACVTFDDGYKDNYQFALPILERLGIKATFFVATGFIGETFHTFAGEYPMMDKEQVLEIAKLGHEIGAHTVNHHKLTKVPLEIAWQEVRDSKRCLEDLLQEPVYSFAYPKGNYNQVVRELVRQAGFQLAVTIRRGLVDTHPDWLLLPRVWISNKLTLKNFKARCSLATNLYRRLRGQ